MKRHNPPQASRKRRLEQPRPDREQCLLATIEAIRALDDARALAPKHGDGDHSPRERLRGIDSQLWNFVEDLQDELYGSDGDPDVPRVGGDAGE